jgi:hypothetical protein
LKAGAIDFHKPGLKAGAIDFLSWKEVICLGLQAEVFYLVSMTFFFIFVSFVPRGIKQGTNSNSIKK